MAREAALGPFRLIAPFARGGMATVWKAVHREQGVPVAMKVMADRFASQPEFVEIFRDEVRAVAGLDHPGVVMVLDHGEVDGAAERESEGRLVAGSPWLAMEMCSGGTLKALRGALAWRDVKAILLAILDALAHAHARGVVHRDLKPGNVLVATRHDLRPGLKLSDFGIAHAMGESDREGTSEDLISGTPMFMAPEQVRGHWRDYGPWTDLYSLGCLVYWLVASQGPYDVKGGTGLLMAHLNDEPVPLVPRCPVPDGFDGWVAGLMCKRSWDRYQAAADAAAALQALGDPLEDRPTEDLPGDDAAGDLLQETRLSLGETWRLSLDERPALPPPDDSPLVRLRRTFVPFPRTWRRSLPGPPSMRLVGAGLSLYGLRSLPLVGRDAERDALWAALGEVTETGRARAVLIRGPAGTGKSRLARWMCERAHELGAANYAKAIFGPNRAPGEALQRMGTTYLRTAQLHRRTAEERVRTWYHAHGVDDEDAVAVLTELLCPATQRDVETGANPVRLTRPSQFYQGVHHAMITLARERPLIVWMDDVQWGVHGLGIARRVLRTQEEHPAPILIVMTLREEALPERQDEAEGLRRLMAMAGTSELRCGPMPPADHARLVRELLGLDEALAKQVEQRTGGNPLFAVQLVGDWVQRGLLKVTTRGFALAPGRAPDLPEDVLQVWTEHLDRILGEFREEARLYLEVAAILGAEVDKAEWDQACDDPQGLFGDRLPGDRALRARLVERLLGERLAVGAIARWTFVHGMLRESLVGKAKDARRWAAHNLACATMLWSRATSPELAPAERLGMHLVAAGRSDDAVAPLLGGVEQRLVNAGPDAAQALLDVAEEALKEASVPKRDKRWGKLLTFRARIHRERGELVDALGYENEALRRARRHGWAGVERYALHGMALIRVDQGKLVEAEELFRQLADAAHAASAASHVGLAELGLAEVARLDGDVETAVDRLQIAADWFQQARDPVQVAETWRLRARCEEVRGDPDAALGLYQRARERFEHLGVALGVAECNDREARLHQRRGNLPAAEGGFRRALRRYEALGSDAADAVRLRLALLLAEWDRPEEVWVTLEPVQRRLGRLEHATRVAATMALGLVQAASRGDWATYEAWLGEDEHPLEQTVQVHAVIAWGARIAGELALRRGATLLARRALLVAEHQWEMLEAPDPLRETRQALRRTQETA